MPAIRSAPVAIVGRNAQLLATVRDGDVRYFLQTW